MGVFRNVYDTSAGFDSIRDVLDNMRDLILYCFDHDTLFMNQIGDNISKKFSGHFNLHMTRKSTDMIGDFFEVHRDLLETIENEADGKASIDDVRVAADNCEGLFRW
jgi:hypothetical protein